MYSELQHHYRRFGTHELIGEARMVFENDGDKPKSSAEIQAQINQVKDSAKSEIPRMIFEEGKTVGDATKVLIDKLDDLRDKNEILHIEGKFSPEDDQFNKELQKNIADATKELADGQKDNLKYETLAHDMATIKTELETFEATGPVNEADLGQQAKVQLIAETLGRFKGYQAKLTGMVVPGFEKTSQDLQKRVQAQIDKLQNGLNILHGKAEAKLTEINSTITWLSTAVDKTSPDENASAKTKEISDAIGKLAANRIVLKDLAALVQASGNNALLGKIQETQSKVEKISAASNLLDPVKDAEALKKLDASRQSYVDAQANLLNAQYPKERNRNYSKNLVDAQSRLLFTQTQYQNALTKYMESTSSTVHGAVAIQVFEAQKKNVNNFAKLQRENQSPSV